MSRLSDTPPIIGRPQNDGVDNLISATEVQLT